MRLIRVVGALVLASSAMLSAQSPALVSPNLNMRLANVTLEQAVSAIASAGGITVQFDDSVPAETRARAQSPVAFHDASMESALQFLASQHRLAIVVVDAKTVRVQAAR